jgi:hypothetical protein
MGLFLGMHELVANFGNRIGAVRTRRVQSQPKKISSFSPPFKFWKS